MRPNTSAGGCTWGTTGTLVALGIVGAVFLGIGFFGCGEDHGGSKGTPFDTFVPPDAPGPYAVGNTSYLMVDLSRWDRSTKSYRQLLVEVWYPVDELVPGTEQAKVLDFVHEPWTKLVVSVFSLILSPDEVGNLFSTSGSYKDAAIAQGGGPFPLIVFSHGNGGVRFQNYTLACHLASHGFIFAAPDHTENAAFTTLPDQLVIYNPLLMAKDVVDRPQDLQIVIDILSRMNEVDSGDQLAGSIDTEHIAVAGHSLGGLAVMTLVQSDPRIAAGLNLAGPWISIALLNMHVPMMYMIGLEDKSVGVPYNPLLIDVYEKSPVPKFLLEFKDGGHFTFSDACILAPSLFGTGDGCGQGTRYEDGSSFVYIDHEQAQKIQRGYVTAFFKVFLSGDARYRPFLAQNHFPESINYRNEF